MKPIFGASRKPDYFFFLKNVYRPKHFDFRHFFCIKFKLSYCYSDIYQQTLKVIRVKLKPIFGSQQLQNDKIEANFWSKPEARKEVIFYLKKPYRHISFGIGVYYIPKSSSNNFLSMAKKKFENCFLNSMIQNLRQFFFN